MNARFGFPLYIAFRYLFSKKSQNAINLISAVSVCSVAVGTMALVCVLSVFNGFENLVTGLFVNFDPQIKITATEGKVFDPADIQTISGLPEVECFDTVLEENALLQFRDKQVPVTVKGVNDRYRQVNNIDEIMFNGEFMLKAGSFDMAVGGAGLVKNIGCGVHFVDPMYLYAPKRKGKVNMLRPDESFVRETVFYAGTFLVQQEQYDNNLLIVSLPLARRLFGYDKEVSAVEIKLKAGADERRAIEKIREITGDRFEVADRYRQQEEMFRMMQVEKWITYLILSFILVIALFNIVGSLSMLMMDKKEDCGILEKLGAGKRDIFNIFLFEGWLITIAGVLSGLALGLLLCYLQIKFGIITLNSHYIVNAYPVDVRAGDIAVIFVTVCALGFAAAAYPASQYLKNEKQ